MIAPGSVEKQYTYQRTSRSLLSVAQYQPRVCQTTEAAETEVTQGEICLDWNTRRVSFDPVMGSWVLGLTWESSIGFLLFYLAETTSHLAGTVTFPFFIRSSIDNSLLKHNLLKLTYLTLKHRVTQIPKHSICFTATVKQNTATFSLGVYLLGMHDHFQHHIFENGTDVPGNSHWE